MLPQGVCLLSRFCLSNMSIETPLSSFSDCADGAEQEEGASVCEYVHEFAVRFGDHPLQLTSRASLGNL